MNMHLAEQSNSLAMLRPYASAVGPKSEILSPRRSSDPHGVQGHSSSGFNPPKRHWTLHLAPLARALAACRPLLMPAGVPFHARKIGPQTFGWNGADAFAAHERMQAMLPAHAERAGCCNE